MSARRWPALLSALALALLGPAAAPAGADPATNVLVSATVYSPSGTSTDAVTVAALQANPGQCPTYGGQSMNELGRQGFVDVQLAQSSTWPLASVLGCLPAPIPLGAVRGITVIQSDGSPEAGAGSELTPADLAPSGSDFNTPSESPVLQALGSVNQYDRPWRGNRSGQTDDDFLDEVQSTQNDQPAPIAIEVFEGPLLTVAVSASRTTVAAGGTVSFSAQVTGANGSPLSYSWNFGGGAPNSTMAAPQATFRAAGQYEVSVQVTDSAGGGGGAQVPITVGAAAPAATGRQRRPGGGTSRRSHSPTGPRASRGNHPGGSAGNHTTPAAPASTKSARRRTSRTSAPAAAGAPARSPRRRAAPRRLSAPAPVTGSGPLVTGQLVSDLTPLPAAASPLVYSVRVPAPSAPPAAQAVRESAIPVLAGVLAIALLLGLGAGRELRGRQALRPGS